MKHSLKPLPRDSRDYKVGAFFVLPSLEELPKRFEIPPMFVGNQNQGGEEDFCSAYATCGMSAIQENEALYPSFSFAAGKYLSGDPDEWGQDMRTAMKSHVKLGAVPEHIVPDNVKEISSGKKRRFSSYPESLKKEALKYRKNTYWKVGGIYDSYDDIRATMWKFRDKKRAVGVGVYWSWGLSQYVLDSIGEGFGHMMYVRGWVEDTKDHPEGLIVQNSAGTGAGKNGSHILTRRVVNEYADTFGSFVFEDMPKEVAEDVLSFNIKETDNWVIDLWKRFFNRR